MVHKSTVPTILSNASVGGAKLEAGLNVTPNIAIGVTQSAQAALPRRALFRLENVALAVTAAQDFGSVKLADLPDGNLLVLGCVVDLTFVGAGGVDTPANVDVGVGTAAASNATLASTMINVCPKIDSTSGSVVKGASGTSQLAVLAASSTDLFLNVGVAISSDGSLTISGTVELTYLDLGSQA